MWCPWFSGEEEESTHQIYGVPSATVMKPHLSHTEEPGWLLSLRLKEEVAMFAPKEMINGLGKKNVFKKKNTFLGWREKKKEKNWPPGTYFFLPQVNYPMQKIIFFKIVRKNFLNNSLEHTHETIHCASAFNIYIAFFSGTCLSSTAPDSSPFHQKSC